MPAVEVEELVVRYGGLVAVDHLGFEAEAGQVTAVLGPNGAGKTTTVEVLEGYRRPDGGRVRVLGLDPDRDHARLVASIGVMLQQGGVYPGIKVGEAVRLFCAYYRGRRDPDELVGAVGLTERRGATWRQLSGGEQQRLSMALALAGRPRALFLDEPTASVDVAGRQRVRSLIRDQAADGCCVVLTSHDLDEVERIADRVVIIDRGRMVGGGSPAELTRSLRSGELHFGAPAGLDAAGLARHLGVPVAEVSPGEYLVSAPPDPARVAAVTAWLAEHDVPLADLRAGRKRLEDVYLTLTTETSVAIAPGERRRRRRR